MVLNIINSVIILILAFLNYRITRNKAYPPFLFALVLGILLLTYILFYHLKIIEIDPLRNRTSLFFLNGVFSFSIGGVLVIYIKQVLIGKQIQAKQVFLDKRLPSLFDDIFYYLSLTFVILIILKAISIVGGPINIQFLLKLRVKLNYQNAEFGVVKYAMPFVFFNGTFRLLWLFKLVNRTEKWRLWSSYFLALLVAILTTGRTSIFFLLLFLFSVLILQYKISLKILIRFILIGYLFFMSIGILLNKGGRPSSSFLGNFETMTLSTTQYILGPTASFQKVLCGDLEINEKNLTFRFFQAIAHRLNISDVQPVNTHLNFTTVPFPTNVYTIFYHYFVDFGWLGSQIIIIMLGILFTFIYISRNAFWGSYMYGIVFYVIGLSFFNEQFFTLLSQWIQLFLYSIVVQFLFRSR